MCLLLSGVCRFGSDSECIFHCHCQSGDPCNPETGHCDVGCEQATSSGGPFTGAGCQIGRSVGEQLLGAKGCRFLVALVPVLHTLLVYSIGVFICFHLISY